MDEKRKRIIVDLIFGAVVAVLVIVFTAKRGYSWVHLLCDGCFTAAVLLLGTGGLKFFRNEGMFDIFAYSIKSVFQIHYPLAKMKSPLEDKRESYAEYKERKKEKRKSPKDLLWAGLIYLVLAVVLFAVYMLVPGL